LQRSLVKVRCRLGERSEGR